MEITKVLNNSTVIVNSEGSELILLGKGIGFGKKEGDFFLESEVKKIEKKFYFSDFGQDISQIINGIRPEAFQISRDIVDLVESELNTSFNKVIYLTLADHISYALERYQSGMELQNILLPEIKSVYKKEFEVSLRAVQYINSEMDVHLSEDEAGFIVLHLINNLEEKSEKLDNYRHLSTDIIQVIEQHYKLNIDKNSYEYARLLTHLKYLYLRILNNELVNETEKSLYNKVLKDYPLAYEAIPKINKIFYKELNKNLGKEEEIYLTIHINKIIDKFCINRV